MTSQEPQALGTEFNGKSGVCKSRPFTTMTKLLLVNVFVVSFFFVFCFFNFISEDMFFLEGGRSRIFDEGMDARLL